MCDYERAQIEKLGGNYGRLLRRDDNSSCEMTLLTNDGKKRVC